MTVRWTGLSQISDNGDTVTLRRFHGTPQAAEYATPEWIALNGDLVCTAASLDVETNGLSPSDDTVIEIGLSVFRFHRETGEFLGVVDTYSQMQDPGRPLPKEIEELTGLTDEMLRGKSIEWKEVDRLLQKAEIVIAHNASFDRAFVEPHLSASSAEKLWGCSLKQVDWAAKGFPVQKLEVLSIFHGFFTDAHRALNDVHALVNLLAMKDRDTGKTYLVELLANARRPFVKLVAVGSPFESKDLLKARRYKWDPAQRAWYKVIYKDQLPTEIQWLESSIYLGAFKGKTAEIPLTENFRSSY